MRDIGEKLRLGDVEIPQLPEGELQLLDLPRRLVFLGPDGRRTSSRDGRLPSRIGAMDTKSLPLEEFAESCGLAAPPRILKWRSIIPSVGVNLKANLDPGTGRARIASSPTSSSRIWRRNSFA